MSCGNLLYVSNRHGYYENDVSFCSAEIISGLMFLHNEKIIHTLISLYIEITKL